MMSQGSYRAASGRTQLGAAMESVFSLLQENVFNRRRWRTRSELPTSRSSGSSTPTTAGAAIADSDGSSPSSSSSPPHPRRHPPLTRHDQSQPRSTKSRQTQQDREPTSTNKPHTPSPQLVRAPLPVRRSRAYRSTDQAWRSSVTPTTPSRVPGCLDAVSRASSVSARVRPRPWGDTEPLVANPRCRDLAGAPARGSDSVRRHRACASASARRERRIPSSSSCWACECGPGSVVDRHRSISPLASPAHRRTAE